MEQLRGPTRSARAEPRSLGQGPDRGGANQHVAYVLARKDRGDGDLGGADRLDILQRMDREVDLSGDQPGVEFLGPQGLAADLGERAILDLVAAGGHRNELDLGFGDAVGGDQAGAGLLRLGHGQGRAAGAEA